MTADPAPRQMDDDRIVSLPVRPKFSNRVLEIFTRAVVEWTREHHPERLEETSKEQRAG